ncbi:MAG: O-antigen ligase family protein [Chlorobium sp.]|nr:O-antigen ligase family protein [Chlorobium sp.]
MNLSLGQIFIIQIIAIFASWLLFFRKGDLPLIIKVMVFVAYMTVPLGLFIKGFQSAIYVSDFVLPILVILLVGKPKALGVFANGSFLMLFFLLVVLPISMGFLHLVMSGEAGLGARNFKGDFIWLYRNITYLFIFGLGLLVNLTENQFRTFLKLNIGLAGVLAVMGLMNYFGPFNFSIVEDLMWKDWVHASYSQNRIGLGFMGLFRGSVGQWFATIVVLVAGTYFYLFGLYRKLALVVMVFGIGMVLLSYSRAGIVGMSLGLVLLGLFGIGGRQRVLAFVGILVLFLWVGLQGDILTKRIDTIFDSDSAKTTRVDAWTRSADFFSKEPQSFFVGVGPTNRETVRKITGAYGAHNAYVDVIFRLGIFGLVSLLGFILILYRTLSKRMSGLDRRRKVVFKSAIIILAVNSVIGVTQDHLLHDYSSYTMGFYLYLLYGVFAGMRWTKEDQLNLSNSC